MIVDDNEELEEEEILDAQDVECMKGVLWANRYRDGLVTFDSTTGVIS